MVVDINTNIILYKTIINSILMNNVINVIRVDNIYESEFDLIWTCPKSMCCVKYRQETNKRKKMAAV